MKTERRYLWRVIDRGKSHVTKFYLTEEPVMRDYPECAPPATAGNTPGAQRAPRTAEENS